MFVLSFEYRKKVINLFKNALKKDNLRLLRKKNKHIIPFMTQYQNDLSFDEFLNVIDCYEINIFLLHVYKSYISNNIINIKV